MKAAPGVAIGIVTTIVVSLANGFHATPYDNFVLLADGFRHGRVWIDWPGPYIDALRYAGRYYVIEAPLPAVLLLPAVMLRGTAANQSFLAAILAGVAAYAGYEICRIVGAGARARIVLVVFLLLGTDLFWCATFGDVWFVAHVASVAFTLLAIRELLGARRGWLVAVFAACAVESRFTMLIAVPVYALLLWFGTGLDAARDADRPAARRSLATFALACLPFVASWVAYNEARWGVPYDIGYTTWYHADSAGMPTGSPFRLSYFAYEWSSFFVQAPEWRPTFPYLIPSFAGVALTWTSPALVLACFAWRPRRLVAAMWLATLACALPNFLYYVDGYAQFGMRHALDFEPFLFVLLALAARRPLGAIAYVLYGYSSLAGAWGVWYWRVFVRPG